MLADIEVDINNQYFNIHFQSFQKPIVQNFSKSYAIYWLIVQP